MLERLFGAEGAIVPEPFPVLDPEVRRDPFRSIRASKGFSISQGWEHMLFDPQINYYKITD
jgi:hypothetical protein